MPQKTVRIRSKMPAKPDWIKVNSTISFPLRHEDIQKLAEAFSEAEKGSGAYANVELSFMGGLDIMLEISYDSS